MKPGRMPLLAWALAALAWGAPSAWAQEEEAPADAPVMESVDGDTGEEPEAELDDVEALRDKVTELESRITQMQEYKIQPRSFVTFTGYADVGFFVPQGNGAGYVQDFGNQAFPAYRDRFAWVFLGDILATPVNSRGDAADLGDASGVVRFDRVHSRGNPTFIVNELNLGTSIGLTPSAILFTSLNFTPASGSEFSLGDSFDLDVVQLEWMPTKDQKTSIFIGKFDSVIGIEYKERKSSQRFGITPSLLHRYTSGTAIGVKARTKLLDERLILAGALTNGSFNTEQFHFYEEFDSNVGKTASGRVALRLPVAGGRFELGASGMYGAQDRARDSSGALWFAGADLQFSKGGLDLKGQWLTGGAPGDPLARAYGLELLGGAYLEADYLITPIIGVLARGEFRDARVWLGDERLYLTKSWRGTVGTRLAFTDNIVLKAEYLINGEYGGVPNVRNNLFTSSLLLTY